MLHSRKAYGSQVMNFNFWSSGRSAVDSMWTQCRDSTQSGLTATKRISVKYQFDQFLFSQMLWFTIMKRKRRSYELTFVQEASWNNLFWILMRSKLEFWKSWHTENINFFLKKHLKKNFLLQNRSEQPMLTGRCSALNWPLRTKREREARGR